MAELFDILTYDFNKASDVLNVPETYTPVVSMVTPSRVAGTYEFGVSLTYNFDVANRSVFMRFSTDGGVTWNESSAEPKDTTDDEPHVYLFPYVYAGGILDAQLEMRKQDATGVLNVNFADLWFKRVG